ncbi:MAG: hypothetical protein NW216_14195 [Hyphomicrobium sp.]|nr:hypothetical protein [Hyphomicrobium sp.]
MRTTVKAGIIGISMAAAMTALAAGPAAAQQLSEKSVRSLMEYAWALVPQQYSMQDGRVIVIDKSKKEEVMVPLDVAGEIIKVGYVSAEAQKCDLPDDQVINYRSLMNREIEKKKWTDQQLVYIHSLHLATVMIQTSTMKLVETENGKSVVNTEIKQPKIDCPADKKAKVKEAIATYVKAGPNFKIPAARIDGSDPAGTATGSTTPASAEKQ